MEFKGIELLTNKELTQGLLNKDVKKVIYHDNSYTIKEGLYLDYINNILCVCEVNKLNVTEVTNKMTIEF